MHFSGKMHISQSGKMHISFQRKDALTASDRSTEVTS